MGQLFLIPLMWRSYNRIFLTFRNLELSQASDTRLLVCHFGSVKVTKNPNFEFVPITSGSSHNLTGLQVGRGPRSQFLEMELYRADQTG